MQYSLLVFEIVFYNHCNIMDVVYKGVVGVGEQAEGRLLCYQSTDSGVLFSVSRDVHSAQDRSRRTLTAV